jgi:hypothetical protein
VTFEPDEEQKVTFAIRGHAVDVVNDAEEDEGAESDVQGHVAERCLRRSFA